MTKQEQILLKANKRIGFWKEHRMIRAKNSAFTYQRTSYAIPMLKVLAFHYRVRWCKLFGEIYPGFVVISSCSSQIHESMHDVQHTIIKKIFNEV